MKWRAAIDCRRDHPPLISDVLPAAMNREEAKQIIRTELEQLRAKPYAELVQRVGAEPITGERTGHSGTWYQVEIEALWDGKPDEEVRSDTFLGIR